jgi:hypothetical protein
LEGPLQLLIALLLAAVSAWAITVLGSGSLERAASAISLLVGGWQPDPWPRGVQEEDRDRPWFGWPRPTSVPPQATIEEAPGSVPADRVRSRTRIR